MADRGFAHLGYSPVFISDVILAFGMLAVAMYGGLSPVVKNRFAVIYIVFTAWSLLRTIPYLHHYKVDALRDAALYIYGFFAFLLISVLLRNPDRFSAVPQAYYRFLRWALVLLPVLLVIQFEANGLYPTFLSGGVRLVHLKLGDLGSHLGGAAAFWTLGLQFGDQHREAKLSPQTTAMIVGWLFCFLFVLAGNRGGLLAAAAAVGVSLLLSRRLKWKRSASILTLAAISVVAILALTPLTIHLSPTRAVSFDKLATNAASLVGESGTEGQSQNDTAEWRLAWWAKIVNYTVRGPYYFGKGYGVNLADDDGFQVAVTDADALRSPHNSTMTVLARSGVLGLALWLLLLGYFSFSMVKTIHLAKALGYLWWSRVCIWIFAYWVAFLINSCFDPVIESPQGGIWFWSLMGFGIAAGMRLRIEADRGALQTQRELKAVAC